MIDTKFQTLAKDTSLQALWLEVVKEDKFRTIEMAKLQGKIKTLEDARQVQIRLNREFREAVGKINTPQSVETPTKKDIRSFLDILLGR